MASARPVQYLVVVNRLGGALSFLKKGVAVISAKNHKRQRRNRQTRKVANAKVLNRNTNLT